MKAPTAKVMEDNEDEQALAAAAARRSHGWEGRVRVRESARGGRGEGREGDGCGVFV